MEKPFNKIALPMGDCMLAKDSMKHRESIDDQKGNKKPEILAEREFIGEMNLSVKKEMVKELYCLGLSRKAIGRILNISKDVLDQQIEIPKRKSET
jgi:DNA-binding NarL/FixJ family response regulator